MLSGRGHCDELITRPEESYRRWCVVVCDLENLKNEEAMTRVGSQRHRKKIIIIIIVILVATFTHGIYNYIPETNHVYRIYSVTAVLYLQFVLHVMLFRP